jgi:hypothetical protein
MAGTREAYARYMEATWPLITATAWYLRLETASGVPAPGSTGQIPGLLLSARLGRRQFSAIAVVGPETPIYCTVPAATTEM